MRRTHIGTILTFFLSMFFLICMPSESYAANNYVEIFRTEDALYSLNINTVEDRLDHVVAWLRFIPRGETIATTKVKGKKVDYLLMFYAVNKNRKQLQLLSVVSYINTSVAQSIHVPYEKDKFKEVVPGSAGQSIYDSIIYANNIIQENKNKNQ